ncbi:MAG: helix-turn-helix transcriptional regulator [Flavobacteriaceae bacterium]|nr:helix-turn-helix transcriptional regulator [Flavobacteriaceae bacterium]
MENPHILIGLAVSSLRNNREISIEKLSHEINMEKKYLWMIEKGKTNITINTLIKICNFFEISLLEFFKYAESLN